MYKLVLFLAFGLVFDTCCHHCSAFRSAGVIRRHLRYLMSLDVKKLSEGETGDSNNFLPFSKDGPGFVDSLPTNLTNQSQRELIRVILGIAVLYLNFRVKVQEAYARVQPPGEEGRVDNDLGQAVDPSGGISEDEGITRGNAPTTRSGNIRFVDLREGTSLPRDKETIFVSAKFLHRGLPLDVTSSEGVFVTHSVDSSQFMTRCGEALSIPSALESAGALQGLLNMKLGGRRHVSLTLGDQGLQPFVPPGGTVIADLEVKETNTV